MPLGVPLIHVVRSAGPLKPYPRAFAIHAVDAEKGLLLVKGAVPGPRGGVVLLRTAAKGA